MSLLIGAFTMGLILSLLALGVYVSFRVFAFADISAEGTLTLGAAITATMLVAGHDPIMATAAAFLGGLVAGSVTGVLHTRFRINGLLAGILVMTALYSINLNIMGKSNIPLLSARTLLTGTDALCERFFPGRETTSVLGWETSIRDLVIAGSAFASIAVAAVTLYVFFLTDLGMAMRATGDNAQMIRALGVSDGMMLTLGLALSNGLVALGGSLLAQYQGFADVQMGIGMVVWGLAAVIIGEALVSSTALGLALTGVVMGSVLFRLLVAIALRWGLNPNNLKLVTAVFVFVALILPDQLVRLSTRKVKAPSHA
jgi:putative ABC transport system permease protein